jgi:hypothetical protein
MTRNFFYYNFKKSFSRNRVAVKASAAQAGMMMPQMTRFDAGRCLFGVSLMCECIKAREFIKTPKFQHKGLVQAKTKTLNNFLN